MVLSTATCPYLQVVILIVAMRKRFGDSVLSGFGTTLIKTLVAVAIMWIIGAVIMGVMKNLPDTAWFNGLRVAIVVLVAAGVYLLVARALRIAELSLLTGRK